MAYLKWLSLTIIVSLACVVVLPTPASASGSDKMASQALRTKLIDVSYDGHTLKEVVADISQKSSVTIVIDPRVMESIDPEEITVGRLSFRQMPAYNILKTIAEQFELAITFRYGMTWLTTPEFYYEGRNILRIYDVRDITLEVKNFPGMKIRLRGNEGSGITGPEWVPDDPIVEQTCVEDLHDIIPSFTGGESWETNPQARIEVIAGMLVVNQVPEVHMEIMKFLNQLRASR